MTSELLHGQLEGLRENFRSLPEDELFRMYLHYMVECRTEAFNRIVDSAACQIHRREK